MESKLIHDAERKAVETVVDHVLSVKDPEERKKSLLRLSYLMEKFFGGFFAKSSFAGARELIRQGGKWWKFVERGLDTLNPHILKTGIMDLGFESGFYGLKTRKACREKYHCNIPWTILFDPTSACNMHCIGCWAAEYGPHPESFLRNHGQDRHTGKSPGSPHFYDDWRRTPSPESRYPAALSGSPRL